MRKQYSFLTAIFCLIMIFPAYNKICATETEIHDAKQQGKKIEGKVIDESGEALIGASVSVVGTNIGTITDLDGGFSIIVPSDKKEIKISYIGYQSQIIDVYKISAYDIVLKSVQELDEVVVVGYGVQRKASLTSAISSISGDDVFKDRGVSNAGVALQGEVPGLIVTRKSSRPGNEGVDFKIRGDVSVNSGSSPLVIIDGVTGSVNELSQLNPNDIDNVSVLKDASAAIYGARSAGGVILVTTKRGKSGKNKVTYNGSVSKTINGIDVPITNSKEWMQMFVEAQTNDAKTTGQAFNNWVFPNREVIDRLLNGEEFEYYYADWGMDMYYKATDLQKEMYGSATSSKHDLSFSGGNDKATYLASIGYADNRSQLKPAYDGEKKWNTRFNLDYKASDLVKLEFGTSYDRRKVQSPRDGVGAGYFDFYIFPIYDQNGDFYSTFGGRNPVASIKAGGVSTTFNETFRLNGKITLDMDKYVKGLSFSGTAAFKKYETKFSEVTNTYKLYDWVGKQTAHVNNASAGVKEEIKNWEYQSYGAFANYLNTINKVHNVGAMIGFTAEKEHYKLVGASRNDGFIFDGSGLDDLNTVNKGEKSDNWGGQNEWGFASFIGRLNYDFSNRYLIEFLGRRDGSSRLHKDSRWKNFYGISGGWRFTEEKFLQDLDWKFLSYGKLRASYGETGGISGIGQYDYIAEMKTGTTILGNDNGFQTSAWINGIRSKNRSWETIKNQSYAIELGLLDNRLTSTIEYFSRKNDGMLIDITYPDVLGGTAPKTNSGSFRTRGWEIELGWRDKIEKVRYNASFQVGDNKSKILNIAGGKIAEPGKNSIIEGKPLNSLYVFQTDGFLQTQEEVDAYYLLYGQGGILPNAASDDRLRPGSRRIVDRNGDGKITNEDIYYYGDTNPHLYFGMKLGAEWNGFDISTFFQGVGNQNVLRSGYLTAPFITNYTNQNRIFLGKTWTEENPNSEYAILSRSQNLNKWNYMNKDVSVQKSRYIRMKSLIIGYTLPETIVSKAKVERVRFYFAGEDLFELTSIKDGYDPEFGENSNNTFPFSRMLTFGVDITF
ncbi:SusC/RagA family TonB-linked outer membrane protein [Dysgonomonas capnocytophagoides]|uniref:SusC/RagA family TonB-linked outer membrane protein n=1 Tax=Dysgonomonas capnocytophagoides TaxID=45254 RepID=UPI0030C7D348